MLFGGLLVFVNHGKFEDFNIREGFILTTASWFLLSAAGALPLYFSDLGLSLTDAFFESLSGITTTGSTVLSGLDDMSRGILLWRSMLQWVGGIGIIAFGIVLLPFLKIGGMQLFQTESSDRSDKILPQSRQLVGRVLWVYIGLSLLCAVTYYMLGMSGFDAINHAMTTLSTGGYSTHDSSFSYFDSRAMQLSATLFMLMGSVPFVLFVKFMHSGNFAFHKDEQVRGFIAIILGATALIVTALLVTNQESLIDSLVLTIFNVVSILSTTGYETADYVAWGPFVVSIFFFLTYLGGCAGSTAGGLKIMRIMVVLQASRRQIKKLIYPRGLFVARYQGKALEPQLTTAVLSFLSLYVFLNALMTAALALAGLDAQTAFSGAATAIANVGPGIGDVIGPTENFSTLPDAAKWILCAGMFLGRLEILTVLVIFTPHFWRA